MTRIQQSIVHVDVYYQGAVVYLLASYRQGLLVVLLLYQAQKLPRTSHIATLANVHKWNVACNLQQFQTAQLYIASFPAWLVRLLALNHRQIAFDEFLCRTATAAHDIHQSLVNQGAYLRSHRLGCLVVKTQRIRKSSIRIGRYIIRCPLSKFAQVGLHLSRPE